MIERKILRKKDIRGISTLLVVAVIVVAVVVIGVGAYLATRGGSGTSPSPGVSPTPTSTSTATTPPSTTPGSTSTASTATPTLAPTSTSSSNIAGATSYEFNETGTASNGTVLDTIYYATKNLGTPNVDLIEVVSTPSSGMLEYIINGAQQKVWVYEGGQWTDISTEYSATLSSVQSSAGIYVNMLVGWGGSGSFKYTVPSGQPNAGDTATFTNIQINPNLPDSLFQGPA